MKASDIQVGKTYTNRGAGRTRRTVVAIGTEHRPEWFGYPEATPGPDELGVLYEQDGKQGCLFLNSFASWAGKEAP